MPPPKTTMIPKSRIKTEVSELEEILEEVQSQDSSSSEGTCISHIESASGTESADTQ